MSRRLRVEAALAGLLLVATPAVLFAAEGAPWSVGGAPLPLALALGAAWLLWLWCALGLGAEVARRVRRGDVTSSPDDGALSRVAARIAAALLSAAALGPGILASGSTAAAEQPPAGAAASPSTSIGAGIPPAAPAAPPVVDAAASWMVAPGDSLWSIADRLVGDGESWQAIARANLGRLMDDGLIFTDPSVILPGWRLDIPPELRGAPSPASAPRPEQADAPAQPAAATAGAGILLAEVPAAWHAPTAPTRSATGSAVFATSALGIGAVLVGLLHRRRRRLGPAPEEQVAVGDADLLLAEAAEPPPLSLTEAAALLAARDGRLDRVSLLEVGPEGAHLSVRGRRRWQAEPVDLLDAEIVAAASPGTIVPLGDHEGRSLSLVVPPGCEARVAGPRASDLIAAALAAGAELSWAGLDAEEPGRLVVDERDPDLVAHDGGISVAGGPEIAGDPVPAIISDLLAAEAAPPPSLPEAGEPAAHAAVVRLLRALPDIDGLVEPLDPKRARRATEVLAYLAIHHPEPVTGDRLRSRVLGSATADAAAKTLFNVTSAARRALGRDAEGQSLLPNADRHGCYRCGERITSDVALLGWHLDQAASAEEVDLRLAHLRAGLEKIDGEPLGAVLAGWEWFSSEGHRSRLEIAVERAACELVDLALKGGLVELARHGLERAAKVVPYSEELASRAMEVAAAAGDATGLRQSFESLGLLVDELDPGSWPSPAHEARYAELLEELRRRPAQASLAAIEAAPRSTRPSAPAAL